MRYFDGKGSEIKEKIRNSTSVDKIKKFFLITPRLGFSVWNTEDIESALELWGNPEVTKLITKDGKMSKEQVEQRLKNEIEIYKNDNIQYWPIFLIGDNDNIGCCGLRTYDKHNNILEIGVHLKPAYWRNGFAKEACLAVMEYAFNTLKIDALFAGHNPKNTASAKLLKSLGFSYTHDEFYPPTGLKHPSYLLKREEYNRNL